MDVPLSLPDESADWHNILTSDPLPNLPSNLHDTIPTLHTYQDTILDTPPLATRAGLYIYLSAMLQAPPTFSDQRITTYLQSRYHPASTLPNADSNNDSISQQAISLIHNSFLVLANAINTAAPPRMKTLIRSFISNKLPPFLSTQYSPHLAILSPPLTIESCVRQALSSLPQDGGVSTQSASSGSFDLLSETRQEFLFSCALHSLIPESSIEDILGDVSMLDLPTTRYTKEDIVTQIQSESSGANGGKIDALVQEMENVAGNSGAIASGIGEVIKTCCDNGDTMGLRGICVALAKRAGALDILMLFNSRDPSEETSLMAKLSTILNNWPTSDSDGGEQHPIYDEFGSVLLFLNAIKSRYAGLDIPGLNETTTTSESTFLSQYSRASSVAQTPAELSEHDSTLLASWIRGLFEDGSISDELMSACKPSEFHLLISTLLDQSIKGLYAKVLSLETLKGGFEYLLEPFLLPSLVAGLGWFADVLWGMQPGKGAGAGEEMLDATMQALHALLRPQRMSKESEGMHAAVLQIVARRLEGSLTWLQKQFPNRKDVQPLLNLLAPYTRNDEAKATLAEVTGWAKAQNGLLLGGLRGMVQGLISWSATEGREGDNATTTPTLFHFSRLKYSLQILGAYKVLDALVDEVQNAGLPDVAIDVVATLILAERHKAPKENVGGGPRIPMTLQNLLQTRFEDAAELAKTDDVRAGTVVRVYRRVQLYDGQVAVNTAENAGLVGGLDQAGMDLQRQEIDDVLAEAEVQNAADQSFLDDQGGDLMGMA